MKRGGQGEYDRCYRRDAKGGDTRRVHRGRRVRAPLPDVSVESAALPAVMRERLVRVVGPVRERRVGLLRIERAPLNVLVCEARRELLAQTHDLAHAAGDDVANGALRGREDYSCHDLGRVHGRDRLRFCFYW